MRKKDYTLRITLGLFVISINTLSICGRPMTISLDTAIFATIISAAVSFGIFGLKEKWIEPRRWKKSAETIKLEKKLEIYGTLITLLQSFHHKAIRDNRQRVTQTTASEYKHALEVPFDADKLDEIFEKSRYLLSDELINKYMEYIQQDTSHTLFHARKGRGPDIVLAELKGMQSMAEREFNVLKEKYKGLTGLPA